MKALLEIREGKAPFVMELLGNFSFVKVRPITPEKGLLLCEMKEAVVALSMAKKGGIQARPARELLNEI
jgi:hypothetical protein